MDEDEDASEDVPRRGFPRPEHKRRFKKLPPQSLNPRILHPMAEESSPRAGAAQARQPSFRSPDEARNTIECGLERAVGTGGGARGRHLPCQPP
eukprot:3421875-Pyramimonas_sp.AAC.1